jgi:hypothetical protein
VALTRAFLSRYIGERVLAGKMTSSASSSISAMSNHRECIALPFDRQTRENTKGREGHPVYTLEESAAEKALKMAGEVRMF